MDEKHLALSSITGRRRAISILCPHLPYRYKGNGNSGVFAKCLKVSAQPYVIGIAAGTGAGSGALVASTFASVIMAAFTEDLQLDFLNLF